jgi:hypothetical protein
MQENCRDGVDRSSKSYVDAIKATPAEHIDVIARTEVLRRQVIMQKAPGAMEDGLQDLTEKEIMFKAKIAIQMMQEEQGEGMEEIEFLHVKKTVGGGTILILKTEEAAMWLRKAEVMQHFSRELGAATAGAALCMVIAEYVPVTFDPDWTAGVEKVKKDSGLEQGAIREVRYIKKAHRRADGQKTAHIIMGLLTPEQANKAIRYGVIIEGKKVAVRRYRMDPNGA